MNMDSFMDIDSFHSAGGAAEFVTGQQQCPVDTQQHVLPKSFRFLDLPIGLRNKVYENLLCPDANPDFDIDVASPLPDTAILYTNRHIYDEAREAMLRANEFVRIFAEGVEVNVIGYLAKIPVQVFLPTLISFGQPEEPCKYDVIIRGRDLDAFVRALSNPAISDPEMPTHVKHHITLHDPLKKSNKRSREPSYSDLRAQERLLQPFRDHFHGFSHVTIDGEVDQTLAAAVVQLVNQELWPDRDTFVASIRKLKDEGNALFRDGSIRLASMQWWAASNKMQRLRDSPIWPLVQYELGPEAVANLAELWFNVHNNQTMVGLTDIRRLVQDQVDGRDVDEQIFQAMQLINGTTRIALAATKRFESTWKPSATQEANYGFDPRKRRG
ncbi:hypothetical protein N0V82_008719 [Gnomoniopsis sp. IMI 355080]|nr:hypothetical protein N0V82_008719 [Gnomoniopsis sp. IMI 355080]